jgi:hypothetical protein
MFPLVILGTYFGVSWEVFFPDDDERYVFEFIRIAGGRHDGTLMILRQHEQNGRITAGVVTEAFSLVPVWGRGYVNLKEFLLFLRQHGGNLVMNAYVFSPRSRILISGQSWVSTIRSGSVTPDVAPLPAGCSRYSVVKIRANGLPGDGHQY